MADETGEVRSLLMRHRLSIVRDLIGTALVQVLLKNGVLTADQEQQLSAEQSLDVRCDLLIELIAREGFEKFKHFCYAIESECSQLISDLINDKLSQADDDVDDDDGGAVAVANDAATAAVVGANEGYDAANITTTVAPATIPAAASAAATYEDVDLPGVTHDDSSLKNGSNCRCNPTPQMGLLWLPAPHAPGPEEVI
uniref:Uncharacterized protein n=1 Tax=Anopheles atroparvus TaxID=41427 RepID=A0A182J1I4_ANOAO